MNDFWHQLNPGFRALAPMEDVTDKVFRRIVGRFSSPDVFFTEFISAESLVGKDISSALLHLDTFPEDQEKPLVAQLWGSDPEAFYLAARKITTTGSFAGIDINMGCPMKKIRRKRACSALIAFPELAAEIIKAVKAGAPSLSVSVKTRIGLTQIVTESWCRHLLEQNLSALTVHGRTAAQLSDGTADWQEIAKVVRLRDSMEIDTLILGNGDITTTQDIHTRIQETRVDGVMIGRGIFNDLTIFNPNPHRRVWKDYSKNEKLEALGSHIREHYEAWGLRKDYGKLKKFYKVYVHGFPGWEELLLRLFATRDHSQALEVLMNFENLSPVY